MRRFMDGMSPLSLSLSILRIYIQNSNIESNRENFVQFGFSDEIHIEIDQS